MNNFRKVARLIWRYNRQFVAIVFFYGLVISGLSLAIPLAIQALVNSIAFAGTVQPIVILSLILFVCLVVSGMFRVLQASVVDLFHRKMVALLAPQINRRLQLVSDEFREKNNMVELTNRYFDIFVAQKSFTLLLTDGFAVALQLIVGMIVVSFYHPFFLIFSFIIIVIFLSVARVFGQLGSKSAIQESKAKYVLAKHLQKQALVLPTDDQLVREETNNAVTDSVRQYDIKRAVHFRHLLWQIIALVSMQAIGGAIFLGLGGWLVNQSQLSLGQLVAAELIITTSLANIAKSGKIFDKWYDLVAAMDKIGQLLAIPMRDDAEFNAIDTDIEFPTITVAPEQAVTSDSIVVPSPQKVIFTFGVVLVAMFGLSMVLLPWQQTSEGYGSVIALDPAERIQAINTVVKGRITKWHVRDGQKVKLGDPIVEVQDVDPLYVERLEQEIAALQRKVDLSRIAADTAEKNWRRQQALVAEGLSSRKESEKAQIVFKKLASDLASSEASLVKSMSNLSRQSIRTVTAPADGTILQVLNDGVGGIIVKEGAKIATFEPITQSLSAEIFVDGNDLSLIAEGRPVRLQFEGWPALQAQGWPSLAVGTFGGIVYAVDSSVTKKGRYRVLVTNDAASEEPWPSTKYLRQGTAVHAWVQLDTVSVGYEIWRKINGFPLGVIDPDNSAKASASKK